jgi:hypothetical protein
VPPTVTLSRSRLGSSPPYFMYQRAKASLVPPTALLPTFIPLSLARRSLGVPLRSIFRCLMKASDATKSSVSECTSVMTRISRPLSATLRNS